MLEMTQGDLFFAIFKYVYDEKYRVWIINEIMNKYAMYLIYFLIVYVKGMEYDNQDDIESFLYVVISVMTHI